jgi:hypothetical protein
MRPRKEESGIALQNSNVDTAKKKDPSSLTKFAKEDEVGRLQKEWGFSDRKTAMLFMKRRKKHNRVARRRGKKKRSAEGRFRNFANAKGPPASAYTDARRSIDGGGDVQYNPLNGGGGFPGATHGAGAPRAARTQGGAGVQGHGRNDARGRSKTRLEARRNLPTRAQADATLLGMGNFFADISAVVSDHSAKSSYGDRIMDLPPVRAPGTSRSAGVSEGGSSIRLLREPRQTRSGGVGARREL